MPYNNYYMKKKKRRKAKNRLSRTYSVQLREQIRKTVAEANENLQPERQIPILVAFQVAGRDLRKTRKLHPDVRMFSAARAVTAHISLSAVGKETTAALENSDLLPVGHPKSTRVHAMSASALRTSRARWIAADPTIVHEESRALVASAFALYPTSVEATHALARIEAVDNSRMPLWVRVLAASTADSLTAALGIGGNSSAARRLRAQVQRRDRMGRFAFMGGGFSFSLNINGVYKTVSGKVVGMPEGGDGDLIEIDIRGDKELPDGVYTVNSSRGVSSKAILDVDALPDETRKRIQGSEIDSEAYDIASLKKADAPSEFRKKSGKKGAVAYVTDDAYSVESTDGGKNLTVRREVGGSLVGKFDNWGDTVSAMQKDQDNYDKYLKTPEGQAELRSGKWDVDVVGDDDIAPPESSTEPVDLDPAGNITTQVADAVRDGRKVRFNYSGKERVLTPEKISTGEKSEKRNLLGKDADGNTKSFTLDKIEAPEVKAQIPEEQEIDVPDNAITFDPKGDIDVQLKDAIKKQAPLVFEYNDKVRVFDPAITKDGKPSYWKNPKNGNINLVGVDRGSGEQKNFTLSKINKISDGDGPTKPGTAPEGWTTRVAMEMGKVPSAWTHVPPSAEYGEDHHVSERIVDGKSKYDVWRLRWKTGEGEHTQVGTHDTLDEAAEAIKADMPNADAARAASKKKEEDKVADEKARKDAEAEIRKLTPDLDQLNKAEESGYNRQVMRDRMNGIVMFDDDGKYVKSSDMPELPGSQKVFKFADERISSMLEDLEKIENKSPATESRINALKAEAAYRKYEREKDAEERQEAIRLNEIENKKRAEAEKAKWEDRDWVVDHVAESINKTENNWQQADDYRGYSEGFGKDSYAKQEIARAQLTDKEKAEVAEKVNDKDKVSTYLGTFDTTTEQPGITADEFESKYSIPFPRAVDQPDGTVGMVSKLPVAFDEGTLDDILDDFAKKFPNGKVKNTGEKSSGGWDIVEYTVPEDEIDKFGQWYRGDLTEDISPEDEKMSDVLREAKPFTDAELQKVIDEINELFEKYDGGALDASETLDRLGDAIQDVPNNDKIYGDLKRQVENIELRGGTLEKAKSEVEKSVKKNATEEGAVPYLDVADADPADDEKENAEEKKVEDFVQDVADNIFRVMDDTEESFTDDEIRDQINDFLEDNDDAPADPDKEDLLVRVKEEVARQVQMAKDDDEDEGPGEPPEQSFDADEFFEDLPSNIQSMIESDYYNDKNLSGDWFDSYQDDPKQIEMLMEYVEENKEKYEAAYEQYKDKFQSKYNIPYPDAVQNEKAVTVSRVTVDVVDEDASLEEIEADFKKKFPGGEMKVIRPAGTNGWPEVQYDVRPGDEDRLGKWYSGDLGPYDYAGDADSDISLDNSEEENLQGFLSEEFDAMFDVPEGAYKVKIFDPYTPAGKTDESSSDYTDDPSVLAQKFTKEEIAIALREAVLPGEDGEQASGVGSLEFDEGEETVPAEALYEALGATDFDADMILAGLYDSQLDRDRPQTNMERIQQLKDDMAFSPGGDFDEIIPTMTDPDQVIRDAEARNRNLGRPDRAAPALNLTYDYEEKNEKIKSLADDLIAKQDEGLGYDAGNLPQMMREYLPLSTSSDPDDREAFSGFWGMMMSLDGGSSGPGQLDDSVKQGDGFRGVVYNALIDVNGGDTDAADDAYEELVETYGGMKEFVDGKEAISAGEADLDSGSTAAAFYRLVKASARPNEAPLYRAIGVNSDDSLFETYTTEGSVFGFDARSFTGTAITSDGFASMMFPAEGDQRRIIFTVAPGEVDSVEAANFSVFAGENEHFGYGTFEVTSVKEVDTLYGKVRGQKDIVVEVRRTDRPNTTQQTGEGATYSGIETWEKIGGQLGSNEGGTYRDPEGKEYYVKVPRSPSHAQNEALASAFYKELGINAVTVDLGFDDGELRIVSPMAVGSSPDFGSKLDDQDYINKLKEGFAIDAWIANWDVVGLAYDNVITDSDGNPLRVDPGGSLLWRARGLPKGTAFGDEVVELDTFRDPDLNPQSASVFGNMTDEEVRASAEKLLQITPERIDELVDSIVTDPTEAATLKTRLKRRRDYILENQGLIPELTARPLNDDGDEIERPELPDDLTDEAAMSEYRGKLADYEVSKAVAEVWDCKDGGGLTAAGKKKCAVPTVDELVEKVNADTAELAPDTKAEAKELVDDIDKFIAERLEADELKTTQRSKLESLKKAIAAINDKIQKGKISKKAAIDELNDLADSIPVGGDSDYSVTLETIQDVVVDFRKIVDGTINDRPPDKNLPPPGSGKGYAKDGTTFLVPGMRVRTKWGYGGTVDRYDKNSWQVWVTMDIDPGGKFAPGAKKMSFATKTLDAINQGDDNAPWVDLPGVPPGKKPQGGLKYKPTKFAGPGKKVKEEAARASKADKQKRPKADAPEGAKVLPENKKLKLTKIVKEPIEPSLSERGTGVAPVEYDKPSDFSVSEIEGVPSLFDVIKEVTREDSTTKGRKSKGLGAAVDSGDIEDLEIAVDEVINEVQGTKSTRLTFKLTSWAVADHYGAGEIFDGNPAWNKENVKGYLPITDIDPDTGAVIEYPERGTVITMIGTAPIENYVYTHSSGVKASVYLTRGDNVGRYATPDETGNFGNGKLTLSNTVRIDIPEGTEATNEVLTEILAAVGVRSPRSATRRDFEILAENRAISVLGVDNTDPNVNVSNQEDRAKLLDDIRKEYGFNAKDIKIVQSSSGRIEVRVPPEVAKKIAGKTKIEVLRHSFDMHSFVSARLGPNKVYSYFDEITPEYAEIAAVGIADILTGVNGEGGSLKSSRRRFMRGISARGQSSHEDIVEGEGGDYVFFNPSWSTDGQIVNGATDTMHVDMNFDPAVAFERLDFYANAQDNGYGKRTDAVKNIVKESKIDGYEVMFKGAVTFDGLRSIVVGEQVRPALVLELNRRGITEINGVPIEDLVLFSGRGLQQDPREVQRLIDEKAAGPRSDLERYWIDNKLTTTDGVIKYVESKTVLSDLLAEIGFEVPEYILSNNLERLIGISPDAEKMVFRNEDSGEITVLNVGKTTKPYSGPGNTPPWTAKTSQESDSIIANRFEDDSYIPVGKITAVSAGLNINAKLVNTDDFLEAVENIERNSRGGYIDDDEAIALLANMMISGVTGEVASQPNPMHYMSVVAAIKKLPDWENLLRELLSSSGLK